MQKISVKTIYLILVISINFATNWYKESIKAKSELRQNILNDIAGEGKKIYDDSEVKALSENTKLMQLWIKNNPKKAEDFLQNKIERERSKEATQEKYQTERFE